MTRREVVRAVLEHRRPPYVPWQFGFTVEAREKLQQHFGPPRPRVGAGQPYRESRQTRSGSSTILGNDRVQRRVRRRLGPQRGQGHRHRRGTGAPRADPPGLRLPRPARPALLRGHPRQAGQLRRPLPRLPDRLLPVRARLDPARHGEPDDGLLRPPRLRARPARRPSPTTTSRRSRQALELRHRRRLLRRRLGRSSAACRWARAVARVHPARAEAHVRRGARGRQVRHHPLLRRRGRAVRRPDRRRAELLQPLPARGDGRARRCCASTAAAWPSTAACPPSGRCPTAPPERCPRRDAAPARPGPRGRLHLRPRPRRRGRRAAENMLAFIDVAQAQAGEAGGGT